jgi:hypothetical protein
MEDVDVDFHPALGREEADSDLGHSRVDDEWLLFP